MSEVTTGFEILSTLNRAGVMPNVTMDDVKTLEVKNGKVVLTMKDGTTVTYSDDGSTAKLSVDRPGDGMDTVLEVDEETGEVDAHVEGGGLSSEQAAKLESMMEDSVEQIMAMDEFNQSGVGKKKGRKGGGNWLLALFEGMGRVADSLADDIEAKVDALPNKPKPKQIYELQYAIAIFGIATGGFNTSAKEITESMKQIASAVKS